MFELYRTDAFMAWLEGLRDTKGRAIINRRLDALAVGYFGDSKQVAKGILEMRIHFGPGYRVYLTRRGHRIVILLCAGDKRTQKRDIEKAIALAENTELEQ